MTNQFQMKNIKVAEPIGVIITMQLTMVQQQELAKQIHAHRQFNCGEMIEHLQIVI
ncbi:hypothetical protein SDC9_118331 [bioreactor metagenome]|uniref:Uncharacterized protein n=1 Tax=bioreactor metagenome TaxID=1076179 RepID=A0A645C2C0_9ZZZZ